MLRVKNTGFRGDRGGIHHNTTYGYAATESSPSTSGSLKRKLQIQSRAEQLQQDQKLSGSLETQEIARKEQYVYKAKLL